MRIVSIAIASLAMVAGVAAGAAATKVTGAKAAQVMHERHEGMETIGKAFKALHREFDASSPFVPTVRSSAAQIANLSKSASGGSPQAPGPTSGKRERSPRSGRTRRISLRNSAHSRKPPRSSMPRHREMTWPPPRRVTPTSEARAKHATTNIGRRCTTELAGRAEAAGLGPSCKAGPLAAAVSDRVQLVVGSQPPHRLAHLVRLRDPDPAHFPTSLGLCRKLDRALLQFCPGPARRRRLSPRTVARNRAYAPRSAQRPCLALRPRGPGWPGPDLGR